MPHDPANLDLDHIAGHGALSERLKPALACATDEDLRRVVSVVDGLAERGSVDALLEGVRPRIAVLRPSRPLRLGRLLAMPLAPQLVPAEAWLRTGRGIPRLALQPVIAGLRAALGEEAGRLDLAYLGLTTDNRAATLELGRHLWTAAADAALPSPLPGWERTRLPAEAAAPILRLCRTLWRAAAQAPSAEAGG